MTQASGHCAMPDWNVQADMAKAGADGASPALRQLSVDMAFDAAIGHMRKLPLSEHADDGLSLFPTAELFFSSSRDKQVVVAGMKSWRDRMLSGPFGEVISQQVSDTEPEWPGLHAPIGVLLILDTTGGKAPRRRHRVCMHDLPVGWVVPDAIGWDVDTTVMD